MESEDNNLTYPRPAPQRRQGFSIHRDNSGPDITFETPADMNYLTAGFRNPLPNNIHNPLHHQQVFTTPLVPRTHTRQPSWGHINGAFRPSSTGQTATYQGISAFGHMAGQHFGQVNNTNVNPHAMIHANVAHAFAGFQQHYGSISQHPPHHGSNQFYGADVNNNMWDMFALDKDATDSVVGNSDAAFQFNGDGSQHNPLFLSDSKAVLEDVSTNFSYMYSWRICFDLVE
jgi:hypothetical protein